MVTRASLSDVLSICTDGESFKTESSERDFAWFWIAGGGVFLLLLILMVFSIIFLLPSFQRIKHLSYVTGIF